MLLDTGEVPSKLIPMYGTGLQMANDKWLKGCQPLCAVKKKCVAAKQCGTILSGVRPSPPPFFYNAKILKTWFYCPPKLQRRGACI